MVIPGVQKSEIKEQRKMDSEIADKFKKFWQEIEFLNRRLDTLEQQNRDLQEILEEVLNMLEPEEERNKRLDVEETIKEHKEKEENKSALFKRVA